MNKPTRSFFRKAVALRGYTKPPVPKGVQHHGQAVLTRVHSHGGKKLVRLMASADAARLMGTSKGGMATHAAGKANRFTTETARKAANKLWATRWKMNKRIGVRLGRPRNLRPRVKRAPLRAHYAEHPTRGIRCYHMLGLGYVWAACEPCLGCGGVGATVYPAINYNYPCRTCNGSGWVDLRIISETAALKRLGYIGSIRAPIPETATPVLQYGRRIAAPKRRRPSSGTALPKEPNV